MIKKIFISVMTFLLSLTGILMIASASTSQKVSQLGTRAVKDIDTTTNFYTQKEDTRTVEITSKESSLQLLGYKKISKVGNLSLWRLDKTMAIAIVDESNGYTWFSSYENLSKMNLSATNKAKIESGVTIEYFDANTSIVSTVELSLTAKKASWKADSKTYEAIPNGFVAHIKFPTVNISFDVQVYLTDKGELVVNVPEESILEETLVIGDVQRNYQLKSISVFPYFGSQNYEINGYSFIPDGSGALIRYTDVPSSTAFIKRVYGADYGFANKSTLNDHIKDSGNVSLPIYGVNHGYNQAAFLCEIISGDGAAELHSYPYNYSNLPLNTTFFKLIARDNYLVEFSDSSTLNLVNDVYYPNDYTLKYTFLSNDKANYVGMAKAYANNLDLNANGNSGNIALGLNVLGVDYKQGLFGKNYIEMTRYSDALDIVRDLNSSNVSNISLTYTGWNKGGYFNKGSNNAKLQRSLGTRNDFTHLVNYMTNNNMSIDFTIAPNISDTYGFGNDTIKRINLTSFDKPLASSLEQVAYYLNPQGLSDNIHKNNKKYFKLGIDGLNIDYLSDSYSYRYKSGSVYRSDMIDIICSELDKVEGYRISTTTPNAYLYKYLTNYYQANYEASKYLYETDSVPFISIVLSGYVNLFSPYINYISDYDLMNLRMVEYNIAPSFMITKEEAYDLRFTNFEYLNSTQYELWADLIKESYATVNGALSTVNGAHIVNHRYVESGVCEVTYSNNVKIYINYNNNAYSNGSITVQANDYYVEGM